MIGAFVPLELTPEQYVGYRNPPAIHGSASVAAGPAPRSPFGDIGTGGIASAKFYSVRLGYQSFVVLELNRQAATPAVAPHVRQMADVKTGFGRSMSRLSEVFGVSRQTLYNWRDGETPKAAHQARLEQLAEAARFFTEVGFKPTALSLDRTVTQGKSLLQLISEGADGREIAKRLVRIEQRGADSRAKLDGMLGGRKSRPGVADLGTPSFDEQS
jgi:transposase-like protein